MRRPKWHLRWNRELTKPDQDGFTHEFTLRVGDSETKVTACCSRTDLKTFLNDERKAAGWDQHLAALALCAQAVKDERNIHGPNRPLRNLNPSTSFSLSEARELAGGAEICMDKALFAPEREAGA